MKAFLAVFLFAAAADAIWPAYPGLVHPTYYTGLPTAYTGVPLLKTLKPEEYTKTFEYKTGLPEMISPYWFPYAKAAKMPEVETKYASQGEYRAEAAGNVVHIAKRSSEEDKAKLILPYAAPWAAAPWVVPAASWSPYTAAAWTPYNTAAWATPFYPHLMPKLVTDDRMKEGTPEYANKGKYVAESAGIVHIAKRSADPLTILPNLYHTSTLPFAPAFTNVAPFRTGYTGFPFVNRYINPLAPIV